MPTNERPRAENSTGYLPQVDALRGLAILAVIYHHFGFHPPGWLDWGPVGPSVFFMLSGYFITLSLWKIQRSGTAGQSMLPQALEFHSRRIFRIFPVLLILVGLGVLFGLEEFRSTWFWHLSFLTNFLVVYQSDWIGSLSHLWSLSLQEQFYILWTLILFVPPAFFVRTMLMIIVGAGGFRLTCILAGSSEYARWLLLPGSLDVFAIGGLVAWMTRHGNLEWMRSPKWQLPLTAAAVASLIFSRYLRFLPDTNPWTAAVEFFQCAFFLWLVLRLVAFPKSALTQVFQVTPLVLLGKLSFGIFAFHTLVGACAAPLLVYLPDNHFCHATFLAALSIVAAIPSYFLLEQPMNRLAKQFDFGHLGRQLAWFAGGVRRAAALKPQPEDL